MRPSGPWLRGSRFPCSTWIPGAGRRGGGAAGPEVDGRDVPLAAGLPDPDGRARGVQKVRGGRFRPGPLEKFTRRRPRAPVRRNVATSEQSCWPPSSAWCTWAGSTRYATSPILSGLAPLVPWTDASRGRTADATRVPRHPRKTRAAALPDPGQLRAAHPSWSARSRRRPPSDWCPLGGSASCRGRGPRRRPRPGQSGWGGSLSVCRIRS